MSFTYDTLLRSQLNKNSIDGDLAFQATHEDFGMRLDRQRIQSVGKGNETARAYQTVLNHSIYFAFSSAQL